MVWLQCVIVGVVISLRDIKTHRIKRKDIYIAVALLSPFINFESCIYGGINVLLYCALFYLSGQSLGFGDVRLAGLIGLYMGGLDGEIDDLFVMNCLTWFIAGSWVGFRSLHQRKMLRDRFAFAPFMFLGLALWNMVDEFEGISEILG
jgi:leader peptidase (prepilin peptidase)/N-methyltransferase